MMKHGTSDRKIGPLTAEEYIEKGKSFHGSMAPGLLIGGFMVDYARKNLPGGEFFDVISETGHCLPDAVQLLTPCTIGNGWLKIIDTGRFAITFYDKSTGDGVRVYLDPKKLESWEEINSWFFRLKPKKEQDSEKLVAEIIDAGPEILSHEPVKVRSDFLARPHKERIVLCSSCGEAYPEGHGEKCMGCSGLLPFI
ncbi:MAG TPA: formylmethanofuran dehydrogenase subunit E family protein [Spirochaetota bacterium]|nr:formylmethanofuran dehydrogenase subunit E family protein [Spirochaetota bacterium]